MRARHPEGDGWSVGRVPELGRQRGTAAFARTDLVGLVAGAVLLGCALVPAWASGRTKAVRIGCVDQLQSLGKAFRWYASDHGDRFPMWVSTNQGGSTEFLGISALAQPNFTWAHFRPLSNYLESPLALICPGDAGRTEAARFEALEGPTARNAAISFGVGMDASESRPLMLLAADRSMVGGRPNFEFDGVAVRGNLGTNLTSLATLFWATNGMHPQAGNGAVGDGSVRQLSSPGLRTLLHTSPDVNNNYAQPGRTAEP